jgi:hypothetical protein
VGAAAATKRCGAFHSHPLANDRVATAHVQRPPAAERGSGRRSLPLGAAAPSRWCAGRCRCAPARRRRGRCTRCLLRAAGRGYWVRGGAGQWDPGGAPRAAASRVQRWGPAGAGCGPPSAPSAPPQPRAAPPSAPATARPAAPPGPALHAAAGCGGTAARGARPAAASSRQAHALSLLPMASCRRGVATAAVTRVRGAAAGAVGPGRPRSGGAVEWGRKGATRQLACLVSAAERCHQPFPSIDGRCPNTPDHPSSPPVPSPGPDRGRPRGTGLRHGAAGRGGARVSGGAAPRGQRARRLHDRAAGARSARGARRAARARSARAAAIAARRRPRRRRRALRPRRWQAERGAHPPARCAALRPSRDPARHCCTSRPQTDVTSLARGTHARCIAFHPTRPLLAVVRACCGAERPRGRARPAGPQRQCEAARAPPLPPGSSAGARAGEQGQGEA